MRGEPFRFSPIIYVKKLTSDHKEISLNLSVKENAVPAFFRILQKGFFIKVQVGCSINELFCGQFGMSPEYFEERVQTVFLNGNPVDETRSAIVKDGSRIALSGAMPGLVGAVLRKGGFYSSLRSGISYREKDKIKSSGKGIIFLKIFNLLLKDLGPAFLKKGILVEGKDIHSFFQKQSEDFWKGFGSAKVDGRDIRQEELLNMKWPGSLIFLHVRPLR